MPLVILPYLPNRFLSLNSWLLVRKKAAMAARLLLAWRSLLQRQLRPQPTLQASLAGEASVSVMHLVHFCFIPAFSRVFSSCLTRSCSNPESLFQGHAAWHVLSASALVFQFVHVCSAFEQGAVSRQKSRSSGVLNTAQLSP